MSAYPDNRTAPLPQSLLPPRRVRTTEIHLCLHLPVDTAMTEVAAQINAFARTLRGDCCYRYDPQVGHGAYHIHPHPETPA